MSVLDRSALDASPLADLHAIASELSIDGYRRLRRADLIGAILAKQGGGESPGAPASGAGTESAAAADTGAEPATDADEPAAAKAQQPDDEDEPASPRRRRGRRGGRGRAAPHDDDADAASATDDSSVTDEADTTGAPDAGRDRADGGDRGSRAGRSATGRDDKPDPAEDRSRSPRSRRGARVAVPAAKAADSPEDEPASDGGEEDQLVEGVVELLANGSGFVRVDPPDPSDDDVYISLSQVKRCELVSGDRVAGPKRGPRRSERFASLVRVETINGRPAAELADSVHFDDLPAAFPSERLKVGSEDPTLKAIEWLTPFGKGSRVTIVGPARSGKSEALRRLAAAITGHDELTVFVALAGARPEEIFEWAQGPVAPVAAVSFAASEEAQNGALEPVIDQARRLAARGADAVVLIDSLDGCSPSMARKALAAARNIVDGGSVTVIATAAEPIGGETTVIALDVALASVGRFPAIDLIASGTTRPELLVGQAGAEAIARARADASDDDDD